jgi:DNA-binding LytR/AlgR family response regulator
MTESLLVSTKSSAAFVCVIDASNVGVRQGASTMVVPWRDIVCVRSEKKRTWVWTPNGPFKISGALADVVQTLGPLGLVRIHRGVAVNASRIRRLVGHGRHRVTLTLDTGDEFLVGRQFQRLVRSRFGLRRSRRNMTFVE